MLEIPGFGASGKDDAALDLVPNLLCRVVFEIDSYSLAFTSGYSVFHFKLNDLNSLNLSVQSCESSISTAIIQFRCCQW